MVTNDYYQAVADYAAFHAFSLGVSLPWVAKGVRALVFHAYYEHTMAEFDIVCQYGTSQTAVHCLVNMFEIRDFLKQRAATA